MGFAPQDKGLITSATISGVTAAQVWVISDGRTGHDKQSLALAHSLTTQTLQIPVRWPPPWRWLAPRQAPLLDLWGRTLPQPSTPTLVIGCGRRTAQATLWLRRRYPQMIRTVQILDPRQRRESFDVLLVPRHDGLTLDHCLNIDGSLHAVDAAQLESARQHWAASWEALPRPRIGVLLGGGKTRLFNARWREMHQALEARLHHGGSVLCSVSPRTPPEAIPRLRDALERWPGFCYVPPGSDNQQMSVENPLVENPLLESPFTENPYLGILACADELWLDGDSINMISEALATGLPVRIADSRHARASHTRFHQHLRRTGLVTDLTSHERPRYIPKSPLADVIAALPRLLPPPWLQPLQRPMPGSTESSL